MGKSLPSFAMLCKQFRMSLVIKTKTKIRIGDIYTNQKISSKIFQEHILTYTHILKYASMQSSSLFLHILNTQYLTNPIIVSPVKMEYWWNFSISGLKMMVKSCLERIFRNSSMRSPCHFYYWICTFDQNSSFLWGKFL